MTKQTVSLAAFRAALERVVAHLAALQEEDRRGGAITALSYIDFRVEEGPEAVRVVAYNAEYPGDGAEEPVLLGYLEDGRRVEYVRASRGVVSGECALEAAGFFRLFDARA